MYETLVEHAKRAERALWCNAPPLSLRLLRLSPRRLDIAASYCAIDPLSIKTCHTISFAIAEKVISTATPAGSATFAIKPNHFLPTWNHEPHDQVADAVAQPFRVSIHRVEW